MFALHLKVKFFFIISDFNFIISNINIYIFESTNTFICYVFSPQHLESFECLQVFSLWTFNTDSEITMFDFIFSVKLWMMLPHGSWPNRKPQDQIPTLQETSGPDPDLEMVLRNDLIHVHTFHELSAKVGQAPVAWRVGVAIPHSSHNPSFSLHSYKCYLLSVWVS